MRQRIAAFSLLEVVVAIGVVVAGVAVILAMLPGLLRRTEEAADLQTALRLPDAVEARLREEMGGSFPGGMQSGALLVADKEGANVRRESQLHTLPTPAFFYIDVKACTSGELAYQPGRPVLPLRVRVGWPYAAVKAAGDLNTAGNFQTVEFLVTLSP